MKSCIFNKAFLPKGYILEKKRKENKGNKRGSAILFVAFLILLPITVNNYFYKESNKDDKKVMKKNEVNISKGEIIKWVDMAEDGIDGNVTSTKAQFIVSTDEKLKALCKKEIISINTIEHLGDNKYKISINKG